MWQFLIEAATLTGLGGIVGLSIGWGFTLLLRIFLPLMFHLGTSWSLVASVGIGLILTWPAWKAARLDPNRIVALRIKNPASKLNSPDGRLLKKASLRGRPFFIEELSD